MSIDTTYNTQYNLWKRPINGSWDSSGNPSLDIAATDSTLDINAGSETNYAFVYTTVQQYKHSTDTWEEIDGTGLQNGDDYHNSSMSWNRQYWINEWDGLKPLRFFLTYRNSSNETYYDYCYYANDTFSSTLSTSFNTQSSSNTPTHSTDTATLPDDGNTYIIRLSNIDVFAVSNNSSYGYLGGDTSYNLYFQDPSSGNVLFQTNFGYSSSNSGQLVEYSSEDTYSVDMLLEQQIFDYILANLLLGNIPINSGGTPSTFTLNIHIQESDAQIVSSNPTLNSVIQLITGVSQDDSEEEEEESEEEEETTYDTIVSGSDDTMNVSTTRTISNDNSLSISDDNSTSTTSFGLVSSLNNVGGYYTIYDPQFHHIYSSNTTTIVILVNSSLVTDTILRLWKITGQSGAIPNSGGTSVSINSVFGSSFTSGGSILPNINNSNIPIDFVTVNDDVDESLYAIPPVSSYLGSAISVSLEPSTHYILEFGNYSSRGGGSYTLYLGSYANIISGVSSDTGVTITSTFDPTNLFLGYVNIPSTLTDSTEKAYLYFNLNTNPTINSSGEKGSILLNRIRKQKPMIPINSDVLTTTSENNTTFTLTEPIRSIPTEFEVITGGFGFEIGDNIVICKKLSEHYTTATDNFTIYRDGIFSNNKALYSLVLRVSSVTNVTAEDGTVTNGVITEVELINANDVINSVNNTIDIPNLNTLTSTSTTYPDSDSVSYYTFVFDDKYLTNTSNSTLKTSCGGAKLEAIIDSQKTLIYLPRKYTNEQINKYKDNYLYMPSINQPKNFYVNSHLVGQQYTFLSSTIRTNMENNIIDADNFLSVSNIPTKDAITNALVNSFHSKKVPSNVNKLSLTNSNNPSQLPNTSIILKSDIQKSTTFDNIPESSFSETNPYIIIDNTIQELDNLTMSELNILEFTNDSYKPFTYNEEYIVSGQNLKKVLIKLENLIVPIQFKGKHVTEFKHVNLHLKNKNTQAKKLAGTSSPTSGLFKCTLVPNQNINNSFVQFECKQPRVIQLNVKDDISIELFDDTDELLEPYEDENHSFIQTNKKIQISLTISIHEIEDIGSSTKNEQQISDTPTNKKSTKTTKPSGSATFLNTKSDEIEIPELFRTNLNFDPKLNK